GSGIAKELSYTGSQVKAEEALSMGLVNKVAEHDELVSEAKNMMKLILKNASSAVGFAKTAINRGMEMDLANGLELEKDIAAISFGTEDKDEGMSAFVQKRPAVFKNK
ncbi:MAG TPA: enoyl-CoA hydratase, partial [Clostridiales bacterium]|nr:enoyl-CoA hydratase [Clostridiales bacterium]